MTPTPAAASWTIQQQGVLNGQLNVVRAVTIAAEGRYIAASGSSFNSLVWERVGAPDQYQRTMQKAVAYGASLNSLAFSPQGYLAVGGAEGSEGLVSVRYLATGDEAFSLPYTIPPVENVAFSNSGNVIAVGTGRNQSGQYGSVHLWFLDFSDRLYELAFEGDSVSGLAFSPDDSLIAAVSASGVSLWQVMSNEFLRILTAETGPSPIYSSLAFAPDGLTIAAGSQEGIVYIWQVANGQRLDQFDTGTKPVQSIAFSADGQQIATVADDGQVTV
jgi:WD40 repeat protein